MSIGIFMFPKFFSERGNMYEILEALMREYNVKPYDIAKKTGISSSLFTDWKKGRYTPKADKLEKIAGYFGLPIAVFFADVTELPEYLKDRDQSPLYHVAAGEGAFNDIYPDEYKDCESDDEYCWCKVEGDSMYPFLMDGDQIRVELTTDISQSDFTVVKVDGEHATVKHVEITKDGVWLRAINKEVYEDHFYSTHEVMTLPVTIVGKVVRMERHL